MGFASKSGAAGQGGTLIRIFALAGDGDSVDSLYTSFTTALTARVSPADRASCLGVSVSVSLAHPAKSFGSSRPSPARGEGEPARAPSFDTARLCRVRLRMRVVCANATSGRQYVPRRRGIEKRSSPEGLGEDLSKAGQKG